MNNAYLNLNIAKSQTISHIFSVVRLVLLFSEVVFGLLQVLIAKGLTSVVRPFANNKAALHS